MKILQAYFSLIVVFQYLNHIMSSVAMDNTKCVKTNVSL